MSLLKNTQARERDNLLQLEAAENAVLIHTAEALSTTLRQRFAKNPDNVTAPSITPYAQFYTDAMTFAWLLGQYHVLLSISDPITLADESAPDFSFTEAMDFLHAQVPTTGANYRNMDANIKLRAFTVAAVSTEQAVNDVKKQYEKALSSGQSASETMQGFNQYLDAAGVSHANPYYLSLHYRNNMMTCYNAGRWTQIVDNDTIGYLIYIAVLDSGTTELCRHLDNTIKPKDHPIWQTYYPPNHHLCRSTVSAYTQMQYDALPEAVRASSEGVTPQSIGKDATMASEHQFTSSPVNQMATLPKSLLEQAQAFDLIPDILNYSQSVSGDVLDARDSFLYDVPTDADVLIEAIRNDPDLDPFAEMAGRITQGADDVRLGFETLLDEDPSLALQYIKQADADNWLVGYAPAYTNDGIKRVKRMTLSELKQQNANTIAWQRTTRGK